MTKVATLILPLPPSINSYFATFQGRRIISKAGRDFKKFTADYCLVSRVPKFGSSRLSMCLSIHPRDRRINDLSNRIKSLEDALVQAGVMDDDSQIDFLQVKRGEIRKGGECVVMIKEIE